MTDLVIGLDCSTTASKAIAWDRTGRAVAEATAPVPMQTPAPGLFEQEPEAWWGSAATALRGLAARIDPARVAALAISTQRETVGFLDAAGQSVRPANVWLDERRRLDLAHVVLGLGGDFLRETTGKPPDPTPALVALAWFRRTEPEAFARTASFVEVHGFLVHRLTGARATSWASADPHGLFDITSHTLSPPILRWFGLDQDRFYRAEKPGTVLGTVHAEAAGRTGLHAGIPVVACGGDGQAAALGCAVLGGGRAYLNLGTAAVSGVFSATPRTADAFRTMTDMTGGYVLEMVLRTGAFLTDWLVTRLLGFDPASDPGCYDRLEAEAATIPPGSDGLLLLPFWSGAMNPHWSHDARGAIAGFAPEHTRGHVYRALIEGIALEMALAYDAIEALGESVREIVAIGGGARSRLWRQIVADATGRPVIASSTVEASSLGAAMLAATGAGWFGSAAEAARAMQGTMRERLEPDPAATARYAELKTIYREFYPALRTLFGRLARFKGKEAVLL